MVETGMRRRLPKLQREQQLIDVAEAVFAARGFREASMDEIALRAGVTKPVLYDHFGSKEGLIAACLRRAGGELFRAIAVAVEEARGPAEVLAAGVAGFFSFIESHGQGWFTLIGESAVVGQAADALEAIRRDQATFIAERMGVEFPQARTQDLEAFAQAIIGACERMALWRRDRPGVSVADATASLTSLLWGGLAALAQP